MLVFKLRFRPPQKWGGLFYPKTLFMDSLHFYYVNPHTLLVVNPSGKIRMLYTPIRMQCLSALPTIPANSWVYVERIATTSKDELQYIIQGKAYSYKFFHLLMKF